VSLVVTLKGCETDGHKCETPGRGEGEVESKKLAGELGFENEAAGKVALDLYPAGHTGPFMEYVCNGVATTLAGSVIVPMKAGRMAVTAALKFKASKGAQKPEAFEEAEKDVLLSWIGAGRAEQTGLRLVTTLTYEEAVEVNSAV
jgi:hypothetical protein